MSQAQPLLGRFFQLGYVGRDLDRCIAQFRRRFGPAEFQVVEGSADHPHTRRIALGYVGQTMIEIIEPNPGVPSIYLDALPGSPGNIRLHHTGHLVDDFAGALRTVTAHGYAVPLQLSLGETLDCCYVDLRAELGHYVEYIRLGEAGVTWFASIPGFAALP
jgi:hypothetical protein